MKSVLATLLIVVAVAVVVFAFLMRKGEVISLVAQQDVQLLDPNTLAGQIGGRPTVVAVLSAGQSLPVIDCEDRKSDIDIVVEFKGKRAVAAWAPGAYQLNRRSASMREPGAISACAGLFL